MTSARQLALAVDAPQRRSARRESRRLYAAILMLRRAGYAVYRRGRHHLVGERQVTSRELLLLAEAPLVQVSLSFASIAA